SAVLEAIAPDRLDRASDQHRRDRDGGGAIPHQHGPVQRAVGGVLRRAEAASQRSRRGQGARVEKERRAAKQFRRRRCPRRTFKEAVPATIRWGRFGSMLSSLDDGANTRSGMKSGWPELPYDQW